jgi:Ca2+-binding EF-hand superfamily protein
MNNLFRHLFAILLAILASRSLCAQTSGLVTAGASNEPDATGAKIAAAEEADEWSSAFLLLDERPLHLQFRITIDGVSLSQARENGVQELIRKLDADQDGKLSHAEFQKSPLVRKVARPKAEKFLKTLGPQPDPKPDDIRAQFARVAGGAMLSIRADGSTAKDDTSIYELIDADKSGLVDAAELARAEQRLRERDTDYDNCVSFEEFQPAVVNPRLIVASLPEEEQAKSVLSEMMIQSQASRQLRPALLKKYDLNKDKALSAGELHWPIDLYDRLDANRDGDLNVYELQGVDDVPYDVQLTVELNPKDDSVASLSVLKTSMEAAVESKRNDTVTLKSPGFTLMLVSRKTDPVEAGVANAMQGFNELDVDANGYVDTTEAMQKIRMQRGLFDLIDQDRDGKVFGPEMKQFVSVAGIPVASTCRLNVYDTGYGFFQILDSNNDGRISAREMRDVDKSLGSMDRDGTPGLSPTEPTRNYRIEFTRGSFVLFGRIEPRTMVTTETPVYVSRVSQGPIWYQRMDRNNDGDLAWEEFLGSRRDFDRLDIDKDGLVDLKEAEAEGD